MEIIKIYFFFSFLFLNITKETLEDNSLEEIVDSVNTLWLNEKIQKKNQAIKIQQLSQTDATKYAKNTNMNQ